MNKLSVNGLMVTCESCKFWQKGNTANGENGLCEKMSSALDDSPIFESQIDVFDEYGQKIKWNTIEHQIWVDSNFGCMAGEPRTS